MNESGEGLYGLLAEFDREQRLLAAVRAVRQAGYERWETSTPYPVHGLDKAAGGRSTRLPWLTLAGGLAGMLLGLGLCWWCNATGFRVLSSFRGYPLVVSGKPIFSLPANVPVIFETTILLASLATVFGLIGGCRLPEWDHPLFRNLRFRQATRDRFFLAIEVADPQFDRIETARLLDELGAAAVEEVQGALATPRSEIRRLPWGVWQAVAVLLALLALPPALLVYARTHHSPLPHIQLFQDMAAQPVLKAQSRAAVFADSRAMRPPPAGTVPQDAGAIHDDNWLYQGLVADKGQKQWAQGFPPDVKPSEAFLERGRQRFGIYCAACHGPGGFGNGPVAERAKDLSASWVPPASLHGESVRARPDGYLFHVISDGVRTMPAYAAQIPVRDRWAIIAYVRHLQRNN